MRERDCFRHNLITSAWSLSPSLLCSAPFTPHSDGIAAEAPTPQILYPEVFAKFSWHLIGPKGVACQSLDQFQWKGNAGSDWSA